MTAQLPQQIEQAPVSFVTLFAYLALAVLTNALNPEGPALVRWGAASPILIQDGDWWRLLTNAYVHWGLVHLLLNSYALYLFGPLLERTIGSVRFFVLYVVTAVTGSIVAILGMNVDAEVLRILMGGSGALFGMMGGMLALVARSGRTRLGFLRNHFARSLMSLIAVNLVLGFMIPAVSNAAHIGGLISGFALIYLFFDTGRERVDLAGRALQGGAIALLLALGAYTLFPVMRWDYQLKRSLTAPTAAERATFSRAVGQVTPGDVEALSELFAARFGPRGEELSARWFR